MRFVPLEGAAARCVWMCALWSLRAGAGSGPAPRFQGATVLRDVYSGVVPLPDVYGHVLWSLDAGAATGCCCQMPTAVCALEPGC